MKRLLKRAARALYRRTEPIRRPLRNELEAHFKACVTGSFEEVRVVLDDLVTEVYRLRAEVAALRDEVAGLREPEHESTEIARRTY